VWAKNTAAAACCELVRACGAADAACSLYYAQCCLPFFLDPFSTLSLSLASTSPLFMFIAVQTPNCGVGWRVFFFVTIFSAYQPAFSFSKCHFNSRDE
jgi:hypothetical protein